MAELNPDHHREAIEHLIGGTIVGVEVLTEQELESIGWTHPAGYAPLRIRVVAEDGQHFTLIPASDRAWGGPGFLNMFTGPRSARYVLTPDPFSQEITDFAVSENTTEDNGQED